MVEADDESHNDDHKPFEGCLTTEARSKLQKDLTQCVYHDSPPYEHFRFLHSDALGLEAKVFGAVRMNILPVLAFLMIPETMESRSSST